MEGEVILKWNLCDMSAFKFLFFVRNRGGIEFLSSFFYYFFLALSR